MKKIEIFKLEGNNITRMRKHCPKCGAGVFLAEHKNRLSCGSCGYTEFKSSGKPQPPKAPVVDETKEKNEETVPVEEKTDEASSAEEKPGKTDEKKPEETEKPEGKAEQPSEEPEQTVEKNEETPATEEKTEGKSSEEKKEETKEK